MVSRVLWGRAFLCKRVRVTQHSVVVGLTVSAVYETCCEYHCLSVDRSARLQIGVVGRIVSEDLPS